MKNATPQNWLAAHLSANLPYSLWDTIANIPGAGGPGKEEHAEALAQGIRKATYIAPERMEELASNPYIQKYMRCAEALSERPELTEDIALELLRAALLIKTDGTDFHVDDPNVVSRLAENLSLPTRTGELRAETKRDMRLFLAKAIGESEYSGLTARPLAKKAFEIFTERRAKSTWKDSDAPDWIFEKGQISQDFLNIQVTYEMPYSTPFYAASEVAEKLGLSDQRVRQIAPSIPGAFKNRSGWQIPTEWIFRKKNEPRPKPGPKPKK